jgi:hypothetical protein
MQVHSSPSLDAVRSSGNVSVNRAVGKIKVRLLLLVWPMSHSSAFSFSAAFLPLVVAPEECGVVVGTRPLQAWRRR